MLCMHLSGLTEIH